MRNKREPFSFSAEERQMMIDKIALLEGQIREGVDEITRLRRGLHDEVVRHAAEVDQIAHKHRDQEAKLERERDALKRENSRLKRVVKALRDAFVAATEEDAPPALPFGR